MKTLFTKLKAHILYKLKEVYTFFCFFTKQLRWVLYRGGEWIVRLSFFLLIFLLILLIRILSEFSRRSAHWKYQIFYGMDQSLDKYHLVTYKFTGQHYSGWQKISTLFFKMRWRKILQSEWFSLQCKYYHLSDR